MTTKYHFRELDDATQKYLLAARDSRGNGMPGLFVPQSSYLPLIGLLLGIGLVFGVLLITLPPLDDPFKVALLQTAGIMLGGWMVVAAVRVWAARSGRSYLGHFVYADASWLWEAKGAFVRVTDLDGLRGASASDNFNQGKYQSTTVSLGLPGRTHSVTVNNKEQGEQLAGFCQALAAGRHRGTARLSPVALGAWARDRVREGADGAGGEEVSELPQPRRANKAPSGLLACLIILTLGVACVFVMKAVNVGARDDAVFELVKDRRPPELRAYLVDPRNTKHRAEVERRLSAFYEPVLRRARGQAQDPELGRGFGALLSSLQTAVQPIVSIRVKEQAGDGHRAVTPSPARARLVEERLANALTQFVGEDLVAFAQAPEGVPAMLEVVFAWQPQADNPRAYRLEWAVNVRPRPDDPPVSKKWLAEQPVEEGGFQPAVEEKTRQTLQGLAGAEDRGPLGGGDFGGKPPPIKRLVFVRCHLCRKPAERGASGPPFVAEPVGRVSNPPHGPWLLALNP